MNDIVKGLWLWCMKRHITLVAEPLPGILNTIADEESWVMKDRTDWMLNPSLFAKIQKRFGPLEVDMFASWLTTQLSRFFSWRPDPEAEAVNAFVQDWGPLNGIGYANPPWSLISRVLTQVQAQRTSIILVAPVWKSQPRYPKLLDMLIDFPRKILMEGDVISAMAHNNTLAVNPQLAVWNISGIGSKINRFRKRTQSCSSHHGDRSLRSLTTHSFESGYAGVTKGILIPFRDL